MNALSRITARAKQLRKGNKNMQWKDAIKKASAEYRSGAKKPVAKKRSKVQQLKKFKAKKAVAISSRLGQGSIENPMYSVRDRIESQIKQTLRLIEANKKHKDARAKRFVRANRMQLKNLKRQLREQNSHISRMLR